MTNLLFLVFLLLLSLWGTCSEDRHVFVFIGGTHISGTSVMERLLSSQPYASGLGIDRLEVADTSHCYQREPNNPRKCKAPENEGIFVTREFMKFYSKRKTICHPKPSTHWGNCAMAQHMTEKDFDSLDGGVTKFRQSLLYDWSMWWNMSKPFLIEKDIPNMSRTRFMQGVFGSDHSAFLFMMRHPMSSCKQFSCNVIGYLKAWISAYTLLENDLEHIDHYLVLHQELLTSSPHATIHEVTKFLGLKSLAYRNGTLNYPCYRCNLARNITSWSLKPINCSIANATSTGGSILKFHQQLKHPKSFVPKGTTPVRSSFFLGSSASASSPAPNLKKKEVFKAAQHSQSASQHPRQLSYHSVDHFDEERREDYVLTLMKSESTAEWECAYETWLPKYLDLLLPFEPVLNKFCYSIYHLKPICNRVYWKKSVKTISHHYYHHQFEK